MIDLPHWQGYRRPDGRKGVRNLVLVVYTVECAKHVAHAIAQNEAETQVIGFPGCYDNQYAVLAHAFLSAPPQHWRSVSGGAGL